MRKQWRRTTLVALSMMILPVHAAVVGEAAGVSPAGMQSGSLLLGTQNGYRVATRLNTNISLNVSGLIARVSVRQEFRNDGPDRVEGIYVFPLPDEAAVDRLRMYVGERVIEGEIREKREARKVYEQAKAAGRKTSLVEQQRANMFTTSVANIAPGETVTVEIGYLEVLTFEEGTFSIRVPLTITPRYEGGPPEAVSVQAAALDTQEFPTAVTQSRDHKVTLYADVNAGVPLEYITSRYHPVAVAEDQGRFQLTLTDADARLDRDIELVWRPVPDASPRAMLFSEIVGGESHVLLMMIPPNDLSVITTAMPRELIFVIDTSGSMHGTSLAQAKRSLILALDRLRPSDRFNVIQFNSITSALFSVSVDATARNVGTAEGYVLRLTANGGTEMAPALRRALSSPARTTHLRQILFITDGSVGNESELFSVIENGLGESRLFTVGIGSAPNGWFMRKAAEAGKGTFTIIGDLNEVNEKMGRLTQKLEQPQLTDIAVQWPQHVEAYPQTVPDLYAGEPIMIRARLSETPRSGDQVVLSGNSTMGSWGAELSLAGKLSSPGVAAIWARARIEDLLDRQRRGADADRTREAVIETALDHHLVSKYTSLVAVDKTPVRPQSAGLSREQVPALLPHGQVATIGFSATATASRMHIIAGCVLLLIAMAAMLVARRRHDHASFA